MKMKMDVNRGLLTDTVPEDIDMDSLREERLSKYEIDV